MNTTLMMRHNSLDLLDLPILVINDILWLVYHDVALIDWLNLRLVCKTFLREIDNLLILRHTFVRFEWKTGVRQRSGLKFLRLRMPASLYAFYLSQKILRTRAAASSCFAQVTIYVASELAKDENGQEESHEILSGYSHTIHNRYEKYIYLLCKAFATATSTRFCCLPLEDRSWGLNTQSNYDFNYAVVTAAAYLGRHNILADPCDERSENLDSAPAKLYGDILSAACRGGYLETVQTLLEQGHVPKAEFLTEAAREGNLEIVKLLAHYKNDSNVLKTHSIAEVENAIISAIEAGHESIINFLLPLIKNKRNTQFFRGKFLAIAASKGFLNPIRQAVALGWNLNSEALRCIPALGHACRAGRTDAVALLLSLGAKPDGTPAPMEQAAAGDRIACMQQLLGAGVDINGCGGHFLIEPCARGKVAAVQFLFNNGFDIASADKWYVWEATFNATFNGYVPILRILAEQHGLAWASVKEAFEQANGYGRNMQLVASALEDISVDHEPYVKRRSFNDLVGRYKHSCSSYCCHQQDNNLDRKVEGH